MGCARSLASRENSRGPDGQAYSGNIMHTFVAVKLAITNELTFKINKVTFYLLQMTHGASVALNEKK